MSEGDLLDNTVRLIPRHWSLHFWKVALEQMYLPGSFINTAIELAGGAPITNGMGELWVNPSIEQIIELDPDIILLSSYYTVEDLSAANGYADMRAVKEGNVYLVNPDFVERPGPRIADAVVAFGEIFTEYLALDQAA